MKETSIPSSVQLHGQDVSFGEINRKFADTSHGEKLKQNIRFSTFKPESTPNKEWERLLGSDVNNYTHLNLTRGLTRSFLKHCAGTESTSTPEAQFSPKEQSLLLLTATVHDWAEAVTGDIAYIHKTTSDEEREMIILTGLLHEVLEEDTNGKELKKTAAAITDVLTNTTSKLGKAFNAIEKVGYIRTGLRAWDQSHKTDGEIKNNLEEMGLKVVPYHLPAVLEYASLYPPVDAYLTYHQKAITQVYAEAEEKSMHRGEIQFLKSKNAWGKRLTNEERRVNKK